MMLMLAAGAVAEAGAVVAEAVVVGAGAGLPHGLTEVSVRRTEAILITVLNNPGIALGSSRIVRRVPRVARENAPNAKESDRPLSKTARANVQNGPTFARESAQTARENGRENSQTAKTTVRILLMTIMGTGMAAVGTEVATILHLVGAGRG
jgi:hypothetical protein